MCRKIAAFALLVCCALLVAVPAGADDLYVAPGRAELHVQSLVLAAEKSPLLVELAVLDVHLQNVSTLTVQRGKCGVEMGEQRSMPAPHHEQVPPQPSVLLERTYGSELVRSTAKLRCAPSHPPQPADTALPSLQFLPVLQDADALDKLAEYLAGLVSHSVGMVGASYRRFAPLWVLQLRALPPEHASSLRFVHPLRYRVAGKWVPLSDTPTLLSRQHGTRCWVHAVSNMIPCMGGGECDTDAQVPCRHYAVDGRAFALRGLPVDRVPATHALSAATSAHHTALPDSVLGGSVGRRVALLDRVAPVFVTFWVQEATAHDSHRSDPQPSELVRWARRHHHHLLHPLGDKDTSSGGGGHHQSHAHVAEAPINTDFLEEGASVAVKGGGMGGMVMPLMKPICKPIIDPIAGVISAVVEPVIGPLLPAHLSGMIADTVPKALMPSIYPKVEYVFVPGMVAAVTADTPPKIARGLEERLTEMLTESITRDLSLELTPPMEARIQAQVDAEATEQLAEKVGLPMGSLLTKSLTQSIAPALLRAIAQSPMSDRLCQKCHDEGMTELCRFCLDADTTGDLSFYTAYYAAYYSSYLADYFNRHELNALKSQHSVQYESMQELQKMADYDGQLVFEVPAVTDDAEEGGSDNGGQQESGNPQT